MQKLLTSLGTGEAIVTVLSAKGVPTPVAWTLMKALNSLMDPSSQATIDGIVDASQIKAKYADVVDRESAYELLAQRLEPQTPPAARHPPRRRRPPSTEGRAQPDRAGGRQLGVQVDAAIGRHHARS